MSLHFSSFFFLSFFFSNSYPSSLFILYLVWEFFFVCFGQIFLVCTVFTSLFPSLPFLSLPLVFFFFFFFFACGVGRTAVVVVDGDGRRRTGRERHIKWSVAWAGWLVGYRTGEGRREGECVRVILYFGWLALGVVDGDGDGDGIWDMGGRCCMFFFCPVCFCPVARFCYFVILLFCYFVILFLFLFFSFGSLTLTRSHSLSLTLFVPFTFYYSYFYPLTLSPEFFVVLSPPPPFC